MDCRDVNEKAIERLAGEAGEATRRELSAHLAGCENCRRETSRLEDVWTTLGMDPDAEITPDFRSRTLGLIEEQMIRDRVREFRPRPRAYRPLLQAAALLGAASLGYVASRALPQAAPSSSPPAPPRPPPLGRARSRPRPRCRT